MRVLLFVLLLACTQAVAQSTYLIAPGGNGRLPQCGPAMDGQVMCRSGVIYECVLNSPNSLERRSGWRWQPDLLRACDLAPPPDMNVDGQPNAGPRGLPPGFTYAPQINEYGTQPSQPGQQTMPRQGRHY